jgi:hypothetical protein
VYLVIDTVDQAPAAEFDLAREADPPTARNCRCMRISKFLHGQSRRDRAGRASGYLPLGSCGYGLVLRHGAGSETGLVTRGRGGGALSDFVSCLQVLDFVSVNAGDGRGREQEIGG